MPQDETLMQIENEIRNICFAGVHGMPIDHRRAAYLQKKYPELYTRISVIERTKAQDEMNPIKEKDLHNAKTE